MRAAARVRGSASDQTTAPIAAPARMSERKARRTTWLDLYVDDLADDQPADDEHRPAEREQGQAPGARGERVEVVGLGDGEEQAGQKRQRGDHAPAETSLRGERAD